MNHRGGICLIKDDLVTGKPLSQFFELEGPPCNWFQALQSGMNALREHHYYALISHMRLPDGDGDRFYAKHR